MTENRYPSPQQDFDQRSLPVVEIASGSYFYRLNSRVNNQGKLYQSAKFFDKTGCGRWDGSNQGYGILYVGADSYAAYIECYGRQPEQRSFSSNSLLITETELSQRFLARFMSDKQLRFVQVCGNGLQKLGVDSQITSCPPDQYRFPREWGRVFHEHPDLVDGICYMSRHDNTKLCYGIFDRVASQISEEQLCDGQFQPLRLETSSEDSCRNLIKLINRQHPEVNLDSVLQHYGHQITTDSPVTGIDIDDVVN
jgi:hypothetical protein